MAVITFLKSRFFLINILLLVLATIILSWGLLKFLGVYTRHKSEVEMPDVRGYLPEELSGNPAFKAYEYHIMDSIYDTSRPGGSIVNQDPHPGSMVKKGRKVYLTVVAMTTEKLAMPDLSDLTLRQAKSVLETYGLKINELSFVPDIGKTVIRQLLGSEIIEAGTLVEKGSGINLVMGMGIDRERIEIPLLVGKSMKEAVTLLHLAGLNKGEETFLDRGRENLKVYMQRPLPGFKASKGTQVMLWYRSASRFDFDNYTRNYTRDSIHVETETENEDEQVLHN